MTELSIGTFFIYLLPIIVIKCVAYYKIFEKCGVPGWKALIPIYNLLEVQKITGKPSWWIAMIIVPVVNIFMLFSIYIDLVKCFDQRKYYQHLAALLLYPIYILYFAFNPKFAYIGTVEELPKLKKTVFEEWMEAIVFAVFAATFIRWIFLEAFVIPTPSMENSLLVGDFLFVSKAAYGPRTPKTPLQVPLTHATFPGGKAKSYLDWIQLPQFRLPGLGEVERNDVVVFNYPLEFENPVDLKVHYIKRCIGVAGDVVKVDNGQVFVNGEKGKNPEKMQFSYFVQTNDQQRVSERIYKRHKIWEVRRQPQGDLIHTTPEKAKKLNALGFIKSVSRYRHYSKGKKDFEAFPKDTLFKWNADFYGPIQVPKKGWTIDLTAENIAKYFTTIRDYEWHNEVTRKNGQLLIDGEVQTQYTFKQNYYFMMGDNRNNSLDSRFFGFVPADHVVGKAAFIWMSLDENEGLLNKVRWERLFSGIK